MTGFMVADTERGSLKVMGMQPILMLWFQCAADGITKSHQPLVRKPAGIDTTSVMIGS